jgi:hypothetical protein
VLGEALVVGKTVASATATWQQSIVRVDEDEVDLFFHGEFLLPFGRTLPQGSFVIGRIEFVTTPSVSLAPLPYHLYSSARSPGESVARTLRRTRSEETMVVALLALFFVLLLFRPRLAFIALAVAIVLLYRGRASGSTRSGPRHVSDDSSI